MAKRYYISLGGMLDLSKKALLQKRQAHNWCKLAGRGGRPPFVPSKQICNFGRKRAHLTIPWDLGKRPQSECVVTNSSLIMRLNIDYTVLAMLHLHFLLIFLLGAILLVGACDVLTSESQSLIDNDKGTTHRKHHEPEGQQRTPAEDKV
ncbi:hypothetical protein BDV96DRAFT_607561 [Lophiotrema nucula]|uniref:Uncharacterized protein n=1 Tax=Lophiotrema nucula TaxID=690887 RepID=A0A6A5YFZ8_9PLEO|nr:hypothetical protein BDV96DRAFT_607561 [Lophiotrema nucula]